MPGLRVDDSRVRDHLRVDIPIRHHPLAHQLDALLQLALTPSGDFAVEAANTGGIGHNAVLAFHTVLIRPVGELSDEAVRDLVRPAFPWVVVILARVRHCELRDGKLI